MSRLEQMKKAIAEKPPAKVKPVAPPPAPPKVKGPSVLMKPQIHYTCGHHQSIESLSTSACRGCCREVQREQRRRQNQRRAEKKESAPPFRLPPGSMKSMVWDGDKWTGALTVPGCPAAFVADGESETMCLRALHREYHKFLDPAFYAPAPVEPTPESKPVPVDDAPPG